MNTALYYYVLLCISLYSYPFISYEYAWLMMFSTDLVVAPIYMLPLLRRYYYCRRCTKYLCGIGIHL